MTFELIDSFKALNTLCDKLIRSKWLAVDTEFLRKQTYYPQLCLIQIATENIIACIDPIAFNDITPLLNIIYSPDTTIVFHAARQDLELLYLIRGYIPSTLFDTQLAAKILGYGDQIGYADLVKLCIDVKLDKSQSRTNWNKRPLDQNQIDYAANDVRYLCNIYHILKRQLKNKNRLKWMDNDITILTNIKTYQPNAENIWRKIKGASNLKATQLAILQLLATWRENHATTLNKPRCWMFKDEVMVDLARIVPKYLDEIKLIHELDNGTIEKYGNLLIDKFTQARKLPEEAWPTIKKLDLITRQQNTLINSLMSLLHKYCNQQAISPNAIASRQDIESIVRGETNIPLLEGWRNEIVGRYLDQFLKSQDNKSC